MDDDPSIVEAVLNGDTERYGDLVNRYQLAVLRLAFGMVGNMEDARDIAQEAFFKAYRALSSFRKEARFSSWLYRIVVNECRDFLRRKSRQPYRFSLSADPFPNQRDDPLNWFDVADPTQNPRQAAFDREVAKRLANALEQLSLKQRTAFLIHYVHGVSLEETARILGCRLGTAKAHLARALERLRILLGPLLSEEEAP
jgi:RNA polymerase sigma-70 factor (ECF subfamily)